MSTALQIVLAWAVIAGVYTALLVWNARRRGALPKGLSLPELAGAYMGVFFAVPPFFVGIVLAAIGVLFASGPKGAVEFLEEHLGGLV